MKKQGKYWVLVTRVEVNETGKVYVKGDEFPDLNDEVRMEKLLRVGILGTSKPINISPNSEPEKRSAFEPSQPYEESKTESKEESKTKKVSVGEK